MSQKKQRLRFEDEPYVRSYITDTIEWKMFNWQARVCWNELIRKVDRAGMIDMGRFGMRGLAEHLRLPEDVVKSGLPVLIEENWVEQHLNHLLIPDHEEAQWAPASDVRRKKEQRARDRDRVRKASLLAQEMQQALPASNVGILTESPTVTKRDRNVLPATNVNGHGPLEAPPTPHLLQAKTGTLTGDTEVTNRDQDVSATPPVVTNRDHLSQNVKFGHEVSRRVPPIRILPNPDPPPPTPKRSDGPETEGERGGYPSGFDAERLKRSWKKTLGIADPGPLAVVAHKIAAFALGQSPPLSPNDLIERAVEAFLVRTEAFSEEVRGRFMFTPESFSRQWDAIQRILAGQVNRTSAPRAQEWRPPPAPEPEALVPNEAYERLMDQLGEDDDLEPEKTP